VAWLHWASSGLPLHLKEDLSLLLAALLPDLPELLVEQAIIGGEAITILARIITPAMPCPGCAQLSLLGCC